MFFFFKLKTNLNIFPTSNGSSDGQPPRVTMCIFFLLK